MVQKVWWEGERSVFIYYCVCFDQHCVVVPRCIEIVGGTAQGVSFVVDMALMNNLLANLVEFCSTIVGDSKVFEDIEECFCTILHAEVSGHEGL